MLGSVEDAEDVVQETYLRWHRASDVQSPSAWLTAVATRLCIDRRRRSATERAAYVGHWLPEPVATDGAAPSDRRAELASDLSIAFLVILERLSPEERAAFLLRDVFDAGYDEIARVLERSETATRQVVHRARVRVRAGQPRFVVPPETTARLLERFLAALAADDQDTLLALVSEDATWTSDGGGKVASARNVIHGPWRIVRLLLGVERKTRGLVVHTVEWINGEPAIVTRSPLGVFCTTSVATDGMRLRAFYRVINPEKLGHVGRGADPALPLAPG